MGTLSTNCTRSGIALLILTACGGSARSDAEEEAAACATILNQEGVEYPARSTTTTSDRQRFEEHAAAFRAHYGEAAAPYSVESKGATISPEIILGGRRDGSGIRLASGPTNQQDFPAVAEQFVARWSEFLNPYGLKLSSSDAPARDEHVSRLFTQGYCGLRIAPGNQPLYTGILSMTVSRSESELLSAQSGFIPVMPLPKPVLQAADVPDVLLGKTLRAGCQEGIFSANTCITSEPALVVFVSPAAEFLEYYIGYELEFRLAGCDDRADWTVIVDALDGSVIHEGVVSLCPDF